MSTFSPATSERWIGRTLRFGVWTSAILMLIGVILAGFQGDPQMAQVWTFAQLISNSSVWTSGVALLYCGLVLLMATPFLRVIAALLGFAVQKEWRYVAVSIFILSMLVGELIIAYG